VTHVISSTLRPRRLAVIATVLAAAMLAMTLTSTASARTFTQARNLCPNGQICFFEHSNYNGEWVGFRGHIRYLDQYNFEDRMSSYLNDSGNAFCLFETGNFDDSRYYVPSAGHPNAATRYIGPEWNDTVSSLDDMDWGMRCT
jgi:Peptidase inhibitor family I36